MRQLFFILIVCALGIDCGLTPTTTTQPPTTTTQPPTTTPKPPTTTTCMTTSTSTSTTTSTTTTSTSTTTTTTTPAPQHICACLGCEKPMCSFSSIGEMKQWNKNNPKCRSYTACSTKCCPKRICPCFRRPSCWWWWT